MIFKKSTDEKILKAFRTEWPELKRAIDPPNMKVLLSRGKAEAAEHIRKTGTRPALSSKQYDRVNLYFVAMACLEFLSYSSCLRKDKEMLKYTQEQCLSMEEHVNSAILADRLPPMFGPRLTARARLIAGVSKEARILVDGYSDTERLWQSLIARASASPDAGPPIVTRC